MEKELINGINIDIDNQNFLLNSGEKKWNIKSDFNNSILYINVNELDENEDIESSQAFQFLLTPTKDSTGNKIISTVKNASVIVGPISYILDKSKIENFIESVRHNPSIPEEERNIWVELLDFPSGIGDFKTANIYSDRSDKNKFERLKDFFVNSNISIVAAEILIPYILLKGYSKINGVDILDKIYSDGENKNVQSIRWSTSSNQETIDYRLSFVKNAKNEEKAISAKSEQANKSTIISFLINYINRYKNYTGFRSKSNMFMRIVQAIKDYEGTNAFMCWVIGAACLDDNILLTYNLEELYNELRFNEKLSKSESKIFKRLENYLREKCASILNENDFNNYPYSLTNIFEKIAVKKLNADENALKEIYNIRFAKFKYTQIEMITNKEEMFRVVVKPPELNDNSVHIKLSAQCGNGSSKNIQSIEEKIHLLTTGSKGGQFIGYSIK